MPSAALLCLYGASVRWSVLWHAPGDVRFDIAKGTVCIGWIEGLDARGLKIRTRVGLIPWFVVSRGANA